MKPKVCFFTVCGGGEDYEFLLGSIEHHARMGRHVVLDTTPPDRAKEFRRLPGSVLWMHDWSYGSGWNQFRFRAALVRAHNFARELGEIVVQLDADEYFSEDSPEALFPFAADAMVSVETIHWQKDWKPYSFGKSEYHARLWPSSMAVTWPVNRAWVASPDYNGNPDHHAVVSSEGGKTMQVDGYFHYHLHYALGSKSLDEETAKATIQGWPNGATTPPAPVPVPIMRWKTKGLRPSEGFL